jgi:hypothetical protein
VRLRTQQPIVTFCVDVVETLLCGYVTQCVIGRASATMTRTPLRFEVLFRSTSSQIGAALRLMMLGDAPIANAHGVPVCVDRRAPRMMQAARHPTNRNWCVGIVVSRVVC